MIVKLKCPKHGVVAEFNYDCTHIGDPLKGTEFCKYCGERLIREEVQAPLAHWESRRDQE